MMTEYATKESRGMVMKPNHSINLVVQETPSKQGALDSGSIL
jgi:hypothetical protein